MTEITTFLPALNRYGDADIAINNEIGYLVKYEDHAAIVAALNEKLQALAEENTALISREEMAIMAKVDKSDFPATDSIVNDIRAQGIHFAANRILAAWETGFIDDTADQVYDISGAILCAIEFLPNASDDEFSRDYADEVRARIHKEGQQ